MIRWPVKNEQCTISSSFLYGLYLFVPKLSKGVAYNSMLTNSQILSATYNHFAKQQEKPLLSCIRQQEIKTLIPCFFSDHYQTRSFLTETCIFCPLTVLQARCIRSLYRRWDFALQMPSSPRMKDVIANLLFELLRIYTHPILAGCSKNALIESSQQNWIDTFKEASSKVMLCDHLLEAYQNVN